MVMATKECVFLRECVCVSILSPAGEEKLLALCWAIACGLMPQADAPPIRIEALVKRRRGSRCLGTREPLRYLLVLGEVLGVGACRQERRKIVPGCHFAEEQLTRRSVSCWPAVINSL